MKKILKVKNIKWQKIRTTENLTEYQIDISNEAREKFVFKNVWTHDWRILYKGKNDGQKIKISDE